MIAKETIQEMPLHEKLFVMETLWEEISAHGEDVQVPLWHQNLLDEREKEASSGGAAFLDWEEARRKISQTVK